MKKLWNKLGGWGMIGLVIVVFIVMFNIVGCAPSPTVEQNESVPSYTVETINLPKDIKYVAEVPQVLSFSHDYSSENERYTLTYVTNENYIKIAFYGIKYESLMNLVILPDPTSYIILQGDN